MTKVDSGGLEFGYELLSAVPRAYELYLEGELEETTSAYDTDPLYYFSPRHTSTNVVRGWHNIKRARRTGGLPYTFIHQPELLPKHFPPYKEVYANKEYKWDKPTLCICNRKNKEWLVEAINFFDEDILTWLFKKLKSRYEIVYFPIAIPKELQDNVDPEPIGDIELAKKHGIKIFTDLCKGKSWNETLLKVFSNCEHYITMNGGYSILASFFSGTNIIYSKPGQVQTREIGTGSFWRWYPQINNVRTLHVPSYDALKDKIKSLYIDKEPCINILIRTTRKNYLRNCMASVEAQTYNNINVVLICDNKAAVVNTRGYKARVLEVERLEKSSAKVNSPYYGRSFPYNKYLDQAQKLVSGFIMFLDDDDKFTEPGSVERIAANVSKDSLLVWKVKFKDNDIKPSFSFGKVVTLYDITGVGFCYHSSKIKYTDWTEWKRADYRTAKKLSEHVKVKWLDQVLTELQKGPHMGSLEDAPLTAEIVTLRLTYPEGRVEVQQFTKEELKCYSDYFERYKICTEQMI